MKRIIFIALFFLIALATVFGQDFTFRGHPWGTSMESVIAKEGVPDDSVTYDDGVSNLYYDRIQIAGVNAKMRLDFHSNELVRAVYSIMIAYDEASRNVFRSIETNLINIYGTPNRREYFPVYNDRKERSILSWSISRTNIRYTSSSSDETLLSSCTIMYISPALNPFGGL